MQPTFCDMFYRKFQRGEWRKVMGHKLLIRALLGNNCLTHLSRVSLTAGKVMRCCEMLCPPQEQTIEQKILRVHRRADRGKQRPEDKIIRGRMGDRIGCLCRKLEIKRLHWDMNQWGKEINKSSKGEWQRDRDFGGEAHRCRQKIFNIKLCSWSGSIKKPPDSL